MSLGKTGVDERKDGGADGGVPPVFLGDILKFHVELKRVDIGERCHLARGSCYTLERIWLKISVGSWHNMAGASCWMADQLGLEAVECGRHKGASF